LMKRTPGREVSWCDGGGKASVERTIKNLPLRNGPLIRETKVEGDKRGGSRAGGCGWDFRKQVEKYFIKGEARRSLGKSRKTSFFGEKAQKSKRSTNPQPPKLNPKTGLARLPQDTERRQQGLHTSRPGARKGPKKQRRGKIARSFSGGKKVRVFNELSNGKKVCKNKRLQKCLPRDVNLPRSTQNKKQEKVLNWGKTGNRLG